MGGEAPLALADAALDEDETVPWQNRAPARGLLPQTVIALPLALVPAFLIALSHAAGLPPAQADPWGTFGMVAPPACAVVLIVQAWRRYDAAHTLHAVTDRRNFIAQAARRTKSMPIGRPHRQAVSHTPAAYDRGTIHISPGRFDDGDGGRAECVFDLGPVADFRRPLAFPAR